MKNNTSTLNEDDSHNLKQNLEACRKLLADKDQQIQELELQLLERKKELSCHIELSALFAETSILTGNFYVKLFDILQQAFQRPEAISFHLKLGDQDYFSENHVRSEHFISQEIIVNKVTQGFLEVNYNDVGNGSSVNGFLQEEKELIFSIVQRLALYLEKREKEVALSESKSFNESMLAAIPDLIFVLDRSGNMVFYNPGREEELAMPPEAFLNKKVTEVLPVYLSDKVLHAIEQLYDTGQATPFEYELAVNERLNHYEARISPFGDDKVIMMASKVNWRKQADEEVRKFRTIADQSNYGTAIVDIDGILTYVNDAFAHMHGWRADELIGKSLMIMHSEEQMAQVGQLLDVIKREGGFVSEEVGRMKKDGKVFPSLMSAKLILDSGGRPQYMSATVMDITKIKETEKALIESKERLHLAQEIAKMGSWDFYVKTGYIRWSRNYYKLLGVDPNKPPLPVEEIKKYIYPADIDLFDASIKSMQQTRKKASIEFRIKMPGQNMRWIQSDILPKHIDNELVSVHGVSIDTTERKQHEAEIRKLSLAIEQSPVAIVITDLEANIQYVSPSFSEITGYTAKDVMGENTRILKSGFTADETYADLWQTIKSGKSWKGEWINKKKDKTFYWENVQVSPVYDEQGAMTNYLAVKEDISDRKRAEQEIHDLNINLEQKVEQRTRELGDANAELKAEVEERKKIEQELLKKTDELETFFTVTLDMLCIANGEGIIIKANNAWEDILGFPVKDVEKRSFKDFVHPGDFSKIYSALEKIEQDRPIFNYIVRLKTKDDQYRDIEWHGVRFEGLIYAAARDITERIKLERTLQESIYKEKELNEIKSRFVSMASHEFRTPLASILLSCESLMSYWKRMDEKQIVSKLNNILDQTQHLSSIVTNVMQVSRIQEGQIPIDPQELDFMKLCQDTIRDFNADASLQNKIVFHSEFNSLKIRIDKRLILQALFNLLSNAIKYSQPDPVVHVNLYIDDDKLILSIKDNGMGIPLRDQKHIFQPFFRADNARKVEGNGLGLSIVRESLLIQGGDVYFNSKEKEGSTFFVVLPKDVIIEKKTMS